MALQPALHMLPVPTCPTLPCCHPPTHPPTQVRQRRVNPRPVSEIESLLHWETVALGSCYVSSGSFSKAPKVSVATAPVFDDDRLPQSIHLAATAEAFPTDSCPDASVASAPHPPPLAGWLTDLAGWLALILEPRGRCTGCRSGAHYDELQANAAVGVEDRRSIAARFSKAERSVDLICAEATCVPTLLLCIWSCPGSVKLPALEAIEIWAKDWMTDGLRLG